MSIQCDVGGNAVFNTTKCTSRKTEFLICPCYIGISSANT
ncbi:Uncharacterised protein [Vibrio cholerae]|nr:Uncharacterised protein [Vibrio cholerae]